MITTTDCNIYRSSAMNISPQKGVCAYALFLTLVLVLFIAQLSGRARVPFSVLSCARGVFQESSALQRRRRTMQDVTFMH